MYEFSGCPSLPPPSPSSSSATSSLSVFLTPSRGVADSKL
jgi:hypothetical protein